jgi:hypothetical protein
MAEFSGRRVAVIAAIAGALVGAVVAAGVAMASTSGNNDTGASAGADGSTTTAPVVRTTLTTSVQEGGSISFEGSYSIAAPSGAGTQDLDQDQLAVTQDEQNLAADQQSGSDASNADNEAIAAAQADVGTEQSSLGVDEAQQAKDCAGSGSSTPACSQDTQKVSQDQTQLNQAGQQLASAQSAATRDHDQQQAKVQSDQTALQGAQATLALQEATAVNPGTTYTALPTVGQIIKEDQSVYSVSNEAVPLLYGSVSAYRAFYAGMSDGADVGELTADLIALGFGGGLTQSNHYGAATAAAVERWQRALGLPVTGEVLLGEVVFEPGPIRVTSVTPTVGESLEGGGGGAAGDGGGGGGGGGVGAGGGGGTVLTATSTTPVVTVNLDVSQEYLVKPGNAVSVVLPDGSTTVGGRIQTVGNVATCPSGGGTGSGTGAATGSSSAPTSTCSQSGSGSNSGPTVPITITLDSTPTLATLDQAPVNVDITTQRAVDVLAVPVNALLALQGGGYGVDVVTGGSGHLVGVTTGLYENNMVQVSGAGISAGMRVQVPSS